MTTVTKNKNILEIDSWKFINISDGVFNLRIKSLKRFLPRIPDNYLLSVNFLFVSAPHGNYLIDLGLGNMPSEVLMRHPKSGYRNIIQKLADYNIGTDSINGIIFTHLHADHLGGFLDYDRDPPLPKFDGISCFVNRREWHFRKKSLKKSDAAYKTYIAQIETNLSLLNDEDTVAQGIKVHHTGGHTPGHQIVLCNTGNHILCYGGDVFPTESQLYKEQAFPYDSDPEQSMSVRKRLLEQARRENWIFSFSHAPHRKFGVLENKVKNEYIY